MRIAIIGEFDKDFRPHMATNEAVEHSRKSLELDLNTEWVSTEYLETNFEEVTNKFQGFWIAPGSPYKSMKGAIELIKYTRIN